MKKFILDLELDDDITQEQIYLLAELVDHAVEHWAASIGKNVNLSLVNLTTPDVSAN